MAMQPSRRAVIACRTYLHWAATWFYLVVVCATATTVTDMTHEQICHHEMASSYSAETAGHPLIQNSPYSLDINQTKYVLGQPIIVTISGTEDFKGFILQARRYGQAMVIGNFQETTREMRAQTCDSQNDTVTGWLKTPRNKITFKWLAPDTDVGTAHFVATIFQDSNTYWTNVTSHSFKEGFAPIDLSNCGLSKGCFRYASDGAETCDASTCTYLATYQKQGTEATFELSATATWVAIGFSSDAMMGGDDVFMCIKQNIGAEVNRYYNEYAHRRPRKMDIDPLYSKEAEVTMDGRLSCRFKRPLKVHEDMKSVDLSNDWYQLYAWGPPNRVGGALPRHELDSPPVSEHKITLSHSRNVISAAHLPHLPWLPLPLLLSFILTLL